MGEAAKAHPQPTAEASPRFSVVTVVLDDLDGLRATAESIRDQTCRSFEWIVVDGGSSDGTIASLERDELPVTRWLSEPDTGIYDAMNKGAALCSGAYVVFMNAGDRFAGNSVLERASRRIDADGAMPDILFGGATLVFPGGRRWYRPPKEMGRYIWHGLPAIHQATYYRRARLQQIGYDPSYRICGDYYIAARLFTEGARATYLDVPLVDFMVGGASFRTRGRLLAEPFRVQTDVLRQPAYRKTLSLAKRVVSAAGMTLLHGPGPATGKPVPAPAAVPGNGPVADGPRGTGVACVACGGELRLRLDRVEDDRFGVPGRYDILGCTACGLEQTVPRPTAGDLKALYERYYNSNGGSGGRYARWRQRFLNAWLYPLWLALDGDISFHGRRGRGRLLDFGCNEGRGLERYRASGFSVEGLEINETAAARARARGFVVHTGEPGALHPGTPYQVVVMSNVLEHALDPGALLAEAYRLLAPGGQLWISCPNAESWQRGVFGRHWINWHVPFHLVHFSRRTLTEALERAGFRVQVMECRSPSFWFAQSLISRGFARPGRATTQLRNSLLVAGLTLLGRAVLFPVLWAGNRLGHGDCLVVTATRP